MGLWSPVNKLGMCKGLTPPIVKFTELVCLCTLTDVLYVQYLNLRIEEPGKHLYNSGRASIL